MSTDLKTTGAEAPERDLATWQRITLERLDNGINFGRRQVREYWLAGEGLNKIKNLMPFGGTGGVSYTDWLTECGISRMTASRLVRLYNSFTVQQIETFSSMKEALKSASAETKEEAPVKTDEDKEELTPAEKQLIEKDALVKQAQLAEEGKAALEIQLKEAAQKIKHLESGERVAEGFQQGVSVIEEAQAETRRLKSRIVELETKEKDALKELAAYTRWVKKATALWKKTADALPRSNRNAPLLAYTPGSYYLVCFYKPSGGWLDWGLETEVDAPEFWLKIPEVSVR